MPENLKGFKIYRRSIRTSFFLVLFLVFVGGIVRSTGAGMGCPDWPKCFGLWVPPLEYSDVPLAYWNDPLSSHNGKLIFNPIKTWTEYLNRLLGVVIGFSILIQFACAFFIGANGKAKFYSTVSFVMVVFQGWLGAKVVSTDLKPLIITIHLVVALLIALALLGALHYSFIVKDEKSVYRKVKIPQIVVLGFFFLLIQFFLGTEVRAQVDILFKKYDYGSRELYMEALDWKFLLHRSFSILVFGLLFLQIFKSGSNLIVDHIKYAFLPLLICIALILSGIVLAYLDFPEFAQPFHLFFGFAVLCAQVWLLLKFRRKEANIYVSG